jgi:hypothetical protein
MGEFERTTANDNPFEPSWRRTTFLAVLMALFLFAGVGAALGVYGSYHQRIMTRQISAHEADLNATIAQLRDQLQNALLKINDLAAVQFAQATAAAAAAQSDARAVAAAQSEARAAASEASTQSARLRLLQSDINNQQTTLQATRAEISRTRSDLEGNLNSTRNELNGSIARTHEELVVLEKRGERDYFEFDAAKSKQFQRIGPLSLTVSRTDPKHANVDLLIMVNDQLITKKGVNLYEPVWIYETQDAQPVQVVVNKIEKNLAHGYVSAPKYSRAELSAISAPAALPPSTRSGTSVAAQSSVTAAPPR